MARDSVEIEGDFARAVLAVHGISEVLTALTRSPDADCVDFEHLGALALVVARELDRAHAEIAPILHAA